jgi:D-glycero-beta-D-manno-heptose 1-phosphate adenylyltransferase
MRNAEFIKNKILDLPALLQQAHRWRFLKKTIVFTNGCFDILHQGHIYSLTQAAKEADFLVVGLNADSSVKKLKGDGRPINDQSSRAVLLSALVMVDAITVFEEDTPLELIKALQPDVLVKGGDYTVEQVAGAKEVINYGGRVVINPLLDGFSTTSILTRSSQKT